METGDPERTERTWMSVSTMIAVTVITLLNAKKYVLLFIGLAFFGAGV